MLDESAAGCLVDTATVAKKFDVLLQCAASIRNLAVDAHGGQDDAVLAELVRKDMMRPLMLLLSILFVCNIFNFYKFYAQNHEIFGVKAEERDKDLCALVKQILPSYTNNHIFSGISRRCHPGIFQ
jgi:hypothetical protein